MTEWIKRLHMYAGLLSFTAFCVWGIAGIYGTVLPDPRGRQAPDPSVRYADFKVPGNLGDQQVADRIIETLGLPFTRTGRKPRRDEDNRLSITYYTPNGRRRLVLLEEENKVRIEAIQTGIWGFLNSLHVATFQHSQPAWPLKMWGLYNEFSIWSVLFMTLTGVYLWLATRPRLLWARYTLAASSGVFILYYVVAR